MGKPRVWVLGGGIRGCSIAAILAESGHFAVTLLEAAAIGCGATSANHGRLHCGTSLWRGAPGESADEAARRASVVRRRLLGGVLIRQAMPDRFARALPSVHLVHPDLGQPFRDACATYGIPASTVEVIGPVRDWVSAPHRNWSAVEVPEYAFAPTTLARRLVMLASHRGAAVRHHCPVRAVTRAGGVLRVTLDDRTVRHADAIVNAASGPSAKFECELNAELEPALRLSHPAVRLLVVRPRDRLPVLDRPAMLIEPHGLLPSVIPHGDALVFHADVRGGTTGCSPSSSSSSPSWPPDWPSCRRIAAFNPACPVAAAQLEACRRFFPPLSWPGVAERLETLCEIYPRLEGLRPSRPFRVHSPPDGSPYWAVSGGNATTTLLDARDVAETMLRTMAAGPRLPADAAHERAGQWLEQLVVALREGDRTGTPDVPVARMAWE